jgi:hypothetical protein
MDPRSDIRQGDPKASRQEIEEVLDALKHWAIQVNNATPAQTESMQSCLSARFLLSLRESWEQHYWPTNPGNDSWRYLFQCHAFRCIGIYNRILEGHPNYLPEIVSKFLQEKWWPRGEEDVRAASQVYDGEQRTRLWTPRARATSTSARIRQISRAPGCRINPFNPGVRPQRCRPLPGRQYRANISD